MNGNGCLSFSVPLGIHSSCSILLSPCLHLSVCLGPFPVCLLGLSVQGIIPNDSCLGKLEGGRLCRSGKECMLWGMGEGKGIKKSR